MAFFMSLSINFAATVERASNPDFATYVTGLDRQGRFVVVSVSVYGSDLIVTDGEDYMVCGVDRKQQNNWGLVDQSNKAVAHFLQQLGASRQVLMDGSL